MHSLHESAVFFSLPHHFMHLHKVCHLGPSAKMNRLCYEARKLQQSVSKISKRIFAHLASCFQRACNYLLQRRSRTFEKLMNRPVEYSWIPLSHISNAKQPSPSPFSALSPDILKNILDRSPASSRSQSSLVCKEWNEGIRLRQTEYFSSLLPAKLAEMYPQLRSISLLVDIKVDVSDFHVLLRFHHLEKLDLSKIDMIDDEVLAILRNLTGLKALILTSCKNITDRGLMSLDQHEIKKTLNYLNLAQCRQIGDIGIEHFGTGNLIGLDLRCCPQIRGWGLGKFDKGYKSTLEDLNLSLNPHIATKVLVDQQLLDPTPHFLNISSLRTLSLTYTEADGGIVKKIAHHLPNLTSLDLSYCREIASDDFEPITSLINLKSLSLDNCKISDPMAKRLSSMASVQSLDLSNCGRLTKSCADHFAKMPALRDLHLYSCCDFLVHAVITLFKEQMRGDETPAVHSMASYSPSEIADTDSMSEEQNPPPSKVLSKSE